MCGGCKKGYYIYDDNCYKCPKVPYGVIVMVCCGLIGLVAFAKFDTKNWMIVAALKQLVSFSQNVNITDLISVAWPELYRDIMQCFKYFSLNLEGTSPECFADSFNWHLRFGSTVGLFLAVFLLLLAGIKLTAEPRHHRMNQRLKRVIFFFFSACYATLATLCVKSFMEIEGRFVYDTSIDFNSSSHVAVMVTAGILLVLCLFGLPIGFAMFTRHLLKHDRLREPAIKAAYGNIYDVR